jgi:osomolarity two-component system response regulator SKN7
MQAFSKEGELGEGGKYLDWSATGDSFVIKDKHHFEKNILVQHFRHCNFSSFVRQLNKYGFKKVRARMYGVSAPADHALTSGETQ